MTKKTNSEKQTDENLVYQYLPFSSFIKMIENKTIKLSNIRRSNDTTELDYGRDVFKEAIFNTLTKRNDITDKNKEIFINNFNEKVKHLDDINEKYILGQFVSCFSNNGDLLSQWRGYSQEIEASRNYLVSMLENEKRDTFVLNGVINGGVSVGFSKDFIDKVTNANTELLSSGKVQYTRRYQTKFFKDSATKIINSYKKCLNDKSDINQFWIDVQIEYEDILIKDTPYIKNPFFREEKEYRC